MQTVKEIMAVFSSPEGAYIESGEPRCGCPDCMRRQHEEDMQLLSQHILDLRTAILELTNINEYLFVASSNKMSARDIYRQVHTIDLIRDLLGANTDDRDSSQVD